MADSIIKKWYLEHHDTAGNKHKFYEVQVIERGVKDFYVTRRFGRIGANTKPKEVASFTWVESAFVNAEEIVSEKRFKNRDRYTLVSQQDVNEPSSEAAKPKPQQAAKPKPTFKIEKEPEPDNNYWGSLQLA
ncbi:WGR domain-containing protein [Vibrio pomeroyi]|uniref:WGR domain-containing protein n=1 Tax=Vibrio pomeroyi TaxID=198832 RepID=A0ABV4MRI0_9VIBR|nr:WGR domain-containing protein [Vibrio atlanticus]MCZ4310180.1 WGR domain-containing protein [Vibrio atlanticus]